MRGTCRFCENVSYLRLNKMCKECSKEVCKFKGNVSSCIYSSLKYGIKSYIWDFLPYNVEELRKHIEKQFLPWMSWMSWDNWGQYVKREWNDNDPSTWTWNVDHIVPQAYFLFVSIRDISFLKCWSLDNLKPLSSKQNILKRARI